MTKPKTGSTSDLPQANSLPCVRDVVAAVAGGHDDSLRTAGHEAGLSERHADYYGLAATRTLALITRASGLLRTTPLGRALLDTEPTSADERALFRKAIEASDAITAVAPDLLADRAPTAAALTARMKAKGLGQGTALRRASCLLSWRDYVLNRQEQLRLSQPGVAAPPDVASAAVPAADIRIENFGPIRKAEVEFADFTVLVGPQATGKSLILQLWKLVIDRPFLLPYLRRSGVPVATPEDLLDVYLGEGMRSAWNTHTSITSSEGNLPKSYLTSMKGRSPRDTEKVFYIPAHRSLLLAAGWPLRFQQLPDAPVVARLFSEQLNLALTDADKSLFPLNRKLKAGLRDIVDDAVFHGARVELEQKLRTRQMRLKYGSDTDLGYMTWTAGQREFVPLLLRLYDLLPSGNKAKVDHVDWVIVEEPEMGLHPQAILAVVFLLLELVHRGYKVIVSTHAPVVLDVIWGLRELKHLVQKSNVQPALTYVRDMFDVKSEPGINEVATSALGMSTRVFAMQQGEQGAEAVDISDLDPSSTNPAVRGWGGLTGLSSRIATAVGDANKTLGRR